MSFPQINLRRHLQRAGLKQHSSPVTSSSESTPPEGGEDVTTDRVWIPTDDAKSALHHREWAERYPFTEKDSVNDSTGGYQPQMTQSHAEALAQPYMESSLGDNTYQSPEGAQPEEQMRYDAYADALERRLETFIVWAKTNWPREKYPLTEKDFISLRREAYVLVGTKLREPDAAKEIPPLRGFGNENEQEFKDNNPMPWP